MNFGRSKNPMFSEKAMAKFKSQAMDHRSHAKHQSAPNTNEKMTVSGVVNKTFILAAILLISSLFSYAAPSQIYLPLGALGAAGVYFIPHLDLTILP